MECKEIPIVIENKALTGKCTSERCEDDQEKHSLQCKECKRLVHYMLTPSLISDRTLFP